MMSTGARLATIQSVGRLEWTDWCLTREWTED